MTSTMRSDEAASGADAQRLHHIGLTVGDLEESLRFWEQLFGVTANSRRLLDQPHIGSIVGHPGVAIDAAWIDVPGSDAVLELVHYLNRDGTPVDDDTINEGNVHFCMEVEDMDAIWERAVALGARPVSGAPVEVPTGPAKGARIVYMRTIDGATIEFIQPAPPS
ncbi:MAG: VOC family protein [bacterium]|nr:VOC family protein [bacterium]